MFISKTIHIPIMFVHFQDYAHNVCSFPGLYTSTSCLFIFLATATTWTAFGISLYTLNWNLYRLEKSLRLGEICLTRILVQVLSRVITWFILLLAGPYEDSWTVIGCMITLSSLIVNSCLITLSSLTVNGCLITLFSLTIIGCLITFVSLTINGILITRFSDC